MIRPFVDSDTDAVVSLWEEAGLTRPWNDPLIDIERKVRHGAGALLVFEDQGQTVGTVMVGYDGHRGWMNYLAVAPECRRLGVGRALVIEAERILAELGCPKVNLQLRVGNDQAESFYRALGYERDEVVSYGRRLIQDL